MVGNVERDEERGRKRGRKGDGKGEEKGKFTLKIEKSSMNIFKLCKATELYRDHKRLKIMSLKESMNYFGKCNV